MKGDVMNVRDFIEKAMSLEGRECDREVWRLAGPANRKFRQEVMSALSGEKVPLSKCGVHAICGKFKTAKKTKIESVNQAEAEVKQSRHELMMIAKDRGIKNFRVLNKEELGQVLSDGVTQEQIDKVVSGAVNRWKAGWGSKKDKK